MLKIFILIYCCLSVSGIHAQGLNASDPIYIERPADTGVHRYTAHNTIFKLGYDIMYEYSLTKGDSVYAAGRIRMVVSDNPRSVLRKGREYPQTIIRYEYLDNAGQVVNSEETGVIDNKVNIWLHPPRSDLFKILELDPFPFICFADSMREWHWVLEVGPSWSDERWKSWTTSVQDTFTYRPGSEKLIATAFGMLPCRETNAKGVSELGTTFQQLFFHPLYGFVEMKWTNIDGSRLWMKLVAMERLPIDTGVFKE
jgi:hypothetical protein